ncbi:MAG: hypothetical protein DKINENOH_04853 [bacterium]|nr:hypothetical protein [bacterium]MCK6562310.1 hypothetical protein [bacterium]NUM65785.1 hypothetical protein [candidate division KSB1 bacterium]
MTDDRLNQCARLRENEIAEAVLGYLSANPDASDTLEGIAEWWIMRQRLRVEVAQLARTLERLAGEGIIERQGEPENPRYRLQRYNYDEQAWRRLLASYGFQNS